MCAEGKRKPGRPRIAISICTFPDCGRPSKARGLCNSHTRQKERTGKLQPIGSPGTPIFLCYRCQYKDCQRAVYAKDLCGTHYDNLRLGRKTSVAPYRLLSNLHSESEKLAELARRKQAQHEQRKLWRKSRGKESRDSDRDKARQATRIANETAAERAARLNYVRKWKQTEKGKASTRKYRKSDKCLLADRLRARRKSKTAEYLAYQRAYHRKHGRLPVKCRITDLLDGAPKRYTRSLLRVCKLWKLKILGKGTRGRLPHRGLFLLSVIHELNVMRVPTYAIATTLKLSSQHVTEAIHIFLEDCCRDLPIFVDRLPEIPPEELKPLLDNCLQATRSRKHQEQKSRSVRKHSKAIAKLNQLNKKLSTLQPFED